MTRIKLRTDHLGDVRLTGLNEPVRFPAADDHEVSVDHERAVELVESHDKITLASGVPRYRQDLRELASELPTDAVHGNMPSDEIVEFLEQFDDAELALLKRNPGTLVERTENRETFYEVEPEDDVPLEEHVAAFRVEDELADASTDEGDE